MSVYVIAPTYQMADYYIRQYGLNLKERPRIITSPTQLRGIDANDNFFFMYESDLIWYIDFLEYQRYFRIIGAEPKLVDDGPRMALKRLGPVNEEDFF